MAHIQHNGDVVAISFADSEGGKKTVSPANPETPVVVIGGSSAGFWCSEITPLAQPVDGAKSIVRTNGPPVWGITTGTALVAESRDEILALYKQAGLLNGTPASVPPVRLAEVVNLAQLWTQQL